MTIPNATKDELEEYRDLERHYAWASQDFEIGMDPEALREALRVLSHYQRENARLARENEKYRSRELQSALRNCSPGQFMEHIKKVAQPKPEVRND